MILPDFNSLVSLAKNEPEKFDKMCQQFNQQLIDSAPEKQKKLLNGLLFKIEMQRNKSKNATQFNIMLSQLLMSSFADMQTLLSDITENKSLNNDTPPLTTKNIIPFPNKHPHI